MIPTPRPRGLLVARVVGVPVVIRPSWFFFAVYLVVAGQVTLRESWDPGTAYLLAASLVAVLLVSVLLHELAHCLVARAFGLPVRSISVGLLAGLTEITEPPQTPAREYAIAVAGPMVSLLLCGVGLVGAAGTTDESAAWLVLSGVALVNGVLALLNLLPGLPLDGGRVLRSVVWHLGKDAIRATRVSAYAGMVLAVGVIPALVLGVLPALGYGDRGLESVIVSALVGAFLYYGAATSLRQAAFQTRLPRLSAGELARPAVGVPATLPLSEAVKRAHDAAVRALVVVDGNGRPEGVVSEAWVRQVPWERRPWVQVADGARRLEAGLLLDPGLSGEALLEALQRTPATEYVVAGPSPRVLVSRDVAAALTGAAVS